MRLAVLALAATAARAACPQDGGPVPVTYAYEVKDGRHHAVATAALPVPLATTTAIAKALQETPAFTNPPETWPAAEPVPLAGVIASDKLKERSLSVDAEPAAECPGASRVRASFTWRFGALARMLGGDAKDIPAMLPLMLRDEAVRRALGRHPAVLDVPAPSDAALAARLDGLDRDGDPLAVVLDAHRHAAAIGGFAVPGAAGSKAEPSWCESCDLGYAFEASVQEGGGGSLGLNLWRRAPPK